MGNNIILYFLMLEEPPETEPVLELVYWKMRGGAQPIRNLLEYLQTPYK